MKSSLSIGEVAERFGLQTHVLRHWESVGLLAPERDGSGRRRFGDGDLVRIAVVLRSRAAGMSLADIRVLVDESAPSRHDVLQAHLAGLERRMTQMRRSREMTLHALECRAHDITACPRFRALVADVVAGDTTWPSDELW